MRKNIYICILAMIITLVGGIKANAAPCPVGGSVTLVASCEINGSASYTDFTISNGVVVTSAVGQKIEINASGTVTIQAGGGIDVSGKGNNTAGEGGDAGSSGVACAGVFAGGGGGGGYGAVGGVGGTDVLAGGAGGATYGDPNNPTDLGSSGGDGGAPASGGGYGGLGGGAVIIKAENVVIENGGYIYANGAKGGPGGPAGGCDCAVPRDGTGGGGGGSGGTVNIDTETFDFNGTITANGGDGGDEWNSGGWDGSGGGGGGGRVFVYYTERTGTGTIEVNGGNPGVLACGVGIPGGSGSGSIGTIVNPCTLGTLICSDRCLNDITREYGGICDIFTGKCVYTLTQSCADAEICTLDGCDEGVCSNGNICGGFVPCGRNVDDPTTPWLETEPCTVCHFFLMLKFATDFLVKIAGAIFLLFLILSGLFYAFASGDSQRLHQARSMFIWTLVGFGIVLLAWLLITVVLIVLGYIDPLDAQWNFIC